MRDDELHSLKSKLAERLSKLDDVRKDKTRKSKTAKEHGQLRTMFSTLPAAEATAIQVAFQRFDRDGSGYLEVDELMACLQDLGLGGTSGLEKQEVWTVLDSLQKDGVASSPSPSESPPGGDDVVAGAFASTASMAEQLSREGVGSVTIVPAAPSQVAVDVVTFALRVVPAVRQRLADLHSDDLLRNFSMNDTMGIGRLGLDKCLQVARSLGVDEHITQSIYDTRGCQATGGADFEELHHIICYSREQAERTIREAENSIKEATMISDRCFQEHRKEIVPLWDVFRLSDAEESGSVSTKSLSHLLGQCGLLPRNAHEHKMVNELLEIFEVDQDGSLSFDKFLRIVKEVRTFRTMQAEEELHAAFSRYDRDNSGALSGEEIGSLLADAKLQPRSRKEQQEFAFIIRSADTDRSGLIDFEEFQILARRIEERKRTLECEAEIERALCNGFSEGQLCDLRHVFSLLDTDGSGALNMNEVRAAMSLLEKTVSNDAFENAFRSVDTDFSGELTFIEFLDFVKVLRDAEGIFADDGCRLPSKLKFLDLRIIRCALVHFGCNKAYVSSLSMQDTQDRFCYYFGIYPNDNIHDRLRVSSVAELIELARRLGQKSRRTLN